MKKILLLLLLFCTHTLLFAQERIQGIMTLAPTDASKIINAVAKPAAMPLGFLQAQGWHSTARPLKKGKFNVQLIGMAHLIPQKSTTFSLNDLGLESVTPLKDNEIGNTLLGDFEGNTKFINPITSDTVRIPAGWGYPMLPYGTLQLNLGIFKNTELSVRFLPKTKIEYVTASNLGVGLKHDIKQWIPAIALSNYSLSIHTAYSLVKGKYEFDVRNASVKDQAAMMESRQWNIGITASKKLNILSVYAGVKYISSATKLDMEGTYLMGINKKLVISNTKDFKDLFSYKYKDSAIGLDVGANIKLGPLHALAGVTLSKYTTFNLGIGLGYFNR